jgi:neutral amino acid transport system substrate-binding protein
LNPSILRSRILDDRGTTTITSISEKTPFASGLAADATPDGWRPGIRRLEWQNPGSTGRFKVVGWGWGHMVRAPDRRQFLQATGLAVLAGAAGCASDTQQQQEDGDDGGTETDAGTDTATEGDGGASAEGEITVGVLLPFTGEYDWVGSNVMTVAEMLAERINSNGGIDGRNVALVQGDTEATVDASVTAAQKLINVDNVQAIIGPTSLTMTGVIDLIQENGVPVISPTAGTTELNDVGGEYIFRTVPSDSLGGRAIAKAATDEQYNGVQSYSDVALMVGQAPALQSFKEPIRSSLEGFGATVTTTLDYSTGKSSYNSEVSNVLNSGPELVCLVGTPEDSARIMRAAFQAGYEGNWFVTQDQTNQDFLNLVDQQITDGILGLAEADSPDAQESGRIEAFTQAVQEYSGEEPGLFAKNTYDAMTVVGLSMQAAVASEGSVSREAVASNVPTVANPPGEEVTGYEAGASAAAEGDVNYEGLVGPVDFDENGDIRSPFAIMRAEGGEWTRASVLPADELE